MAILGGMDTGFGSQVKLVKTNILVTRMTADTDTDQPLCNMLELVNQRLPLNLQCDYICIGHTSPTALSITSGVVTTHGEKDNFSLMGPSADSMAKASGLGSHANTLTDVQKNATAITHMITSAVAIKVTADTVTDGFDNFATEILNPVGFGDSPVETKMNSGILIHELQRFQGDAVGNGADLEAVISDVALSGLSTIAYTSAALNQDFIQPGNAAGVTPTTFTSLDTIINNKVFGILSVTAIVQPAQ